MLQKRFATLAILVIMSMLLASCGGGTATPVPATATNAPAAAATDTTAPEAQATDTTAPEAATATTPAKAEETATQGTAGGDKPFAGKTVTIFGVAADEQARLFQNEFTAFQERTGIKVVYEGN
ncbi:MAG: hypothetical protein QOH93_3034, partial [Chloroflexia bacterium]|nr:hypothetical protein [Chloroflexia bacterium]